MRLTIAFENQNGSLLNHREFVQHFATFHGLMEMRNGKIALMHKNGNIETIGTIKARLEIVQVTALTKSLILSDANTEQEMSNAAAQTLTVEPDSTTNFPIGTRITVINFGVGVVTIAEGSGVTIVRANSLVMNGQGSSVELVKRLANTWSLVGGAI